MFQLFGFAKGTAQKNTNGFGLGLVISKSIVTKFEGEIDFDSIPEEGTTFTFTFKLGELNDGDMNIEELQLNHYTFNENKLIFEW